MSNRLFRMYHLLTCTVMEGRSGCSRIFHLGLFLVDRMNPHSSEYVSNPPPSKRFRFFVPVDFQSEILPKPAKPAIFPKILLVLTTRVGFGDRRPRFERVHFFDFSIFSPVPKFFDSGFLFPRKRTTTRTHNCWHSIRAGQLGR